MYLNYRKSFPEVMEILPEDLLKIIAEEPVVLVDVRSPREQAVSMLPHAVPHHVFLKNLPAYQGRRIVAYCTVAYRSGKLARKLHERGVRVANLRGGILGWLHAGGKVHRDGMPVKAVHVYGKKWDLAPGDYLTVY
jgi:sodium/bile acid cotransporter 7